jgi:ATP synthase F1 delta subunit
MAKQAPLRSYAEAYVSTLSKKSDGVESLYSFYQSISCHPSIRSFLSDTSISKEDRITAIRMVHEEADEETISFIRMLGEDGLLEKLDRIIDQVRKSYKKLTSQEYVGITSAIALTSEEKKRIKQALARDNEREIRLELKIDPTIIGGLIIQQNDKVLNASVQGRLDQLKRLLNV